MAKKYKARFSYTAEELFSDDLILLVEEVKRKLIAGSYHMEIVTIYNQETHEVIDRMEFSRGLFSNDTNFKMRGIF